MYKYNFNDLLLTYKCIFNLLFSPFNKIFNDCFSCLMRICKFIFYAHIVEFRAYNLSSTIIIIISYVSAFVAICRKIERN